MIRLFPSAILLLFLGLIATTAQIRTLDEFHFGYGGFSLRAGTPSDAVPVNFKLDDYQIWGNSFLWNQRDFRMRVSVCMGGKIKQQFVNSDKDVVIAKWKVQILGAMDKKSTVRERPYTFGGFQGIEVIANSEELSVTRLFFLKTLLIEETISTPKTNDLADAQAILDSFRLLDKTERTLAMIREFTPPPLDQERPDRLPDSDATELGLLGAVKLVRDTYQMDSKSEKQIVQEIYFDHQGFTSVEIAFNQGFPDIITSWGWVNGNRVNLQSAVNYPPMEGPFGGRTAVVSGYLSSPDSRYGNLIKAKSDDTGRITERSRYTSSGSLVYVERFSWEKDRLTIKTIDSGGGFISLVRNRLDQHNNVLESETLSDKGDVFRSTRFEYQFDEKGNWIVKRAFSKLGAGRRSVSRPFGVYYRSISYYESDKRQMS